MDNTSYYIKGKLHRVDGPAKIEDLGDRIKESWYYKGKLHNNHKPAVIIICKATRNIVRKEYWFKGRLHRENGLPSIVVGDMYCHNNVEPYNKPKKDIVLLSGEINSGKNQVYDYIVPMVKAKGKKVENLFFAQRLKNMCEVTFERYGNYLKHITSDIAEYVVDKDAKNKLMSLNFNNDNWYEDKTHSTRLILQDMGTTFVRDYIDKDYWVKCVVEDIESSDADVIVITDFRFANEFDVLYRLINNNKYNIKTLRIERSVDTKSIIKHHTSENSLSKFDFDSVINNNGTLEELKEKVSIWVDRLKPTYKPREWE
jgi:hypothetical protein